MARRPTPRARLGVPQVLAGALSRGRLIYQLDQTRYRVGLVTAPAGFGKTTLLAEWARRHRDPIAWLSCDASSSEPVRFWSSVLASIGHTWAGVGDDAAVLLEREGENIDVAISLANDLGEVRAPVVVIDDIHFARPTPLVLLTFIQALPDTARLVLGSRVDLPFSLTRLKLTGQVMEIREDDIRFSLEESAQFLVDEGIELGLEEFRRLYELTEGWPAGLRMASLAMKRDPDRSGFLRSFSGTEQGVTDFLITEVLDRLPADLVQFMLETSVLESLDDSLCAAITGREDAERYLQQLLDAHLFSVPLDPSRRHFRYHHLFGEFLRARLKARGGDQAVRLRAADALLARGDLAGALRQAIRVDDSRRATEILHTGSLRALDVADRSMSATLARAWLAQYGLEQVAPDPVHVLEVTVILLMASNSEEVVWWLTQVELRHPAPPPELEALLAGIWAEYHLGRGQADMAIERARGALAAVERAGHREGLLSTAPIVLAGAYLEAGDAEAARAAVGTIAGSPPGTVIADRVRAPALSAYAAASLGELTEAEDGANEALRTADQLQLHARDVGCILGRLALASVRLERNELEEVSPLLDEARRGAEEIGRPSSLSLVALEKAKWLAASGDVEGAFGQIDNVRAWFPDRSPSMETDLVLRAARLAVQFTDERASGLLSKLPQSPGASVLRARDRLARGDSRRAVELLEAAVGLPSRKERVERGVLLALAWLHRDLDVAIGRLEEALALAYPQRLVRTIIDLGSGVSRVLAAFPLDPRLDDYVEALVLAADTVVPAGRRVIQTALIEPLTDRELMILRYLSSRLTYKEIASLLYISVNTLKTHVRAVFRKLEVDSRSSAVKTGRTLRLL